MRSVVLAEVETGVKICDLIAVTVEQTSRRLVTLVDPDPLLFGLIAVTSDVGIHIAIETIVGRDGAVPGGWRLLFGEANPDNTFDALESIFPGDHQPQGCAILIWQDLAIQ